MNIQFYIRKSFTLTLYDNVDVTKLIRQFRLKSWKSFIQNISLNKAEAPH